MLRRILQSVIGSTGRAASPTGRGSSPTATAAAANYGIGSKREFNVYLPFSEDVIRTDYTKLFFASEKNVVNNAPKVQGQEQGHTKSANKTFKSINKTKLTETAPSGGQAKRTPGGTKPEEERHRATPVALSGVQKTYSKESLQRTLPRWTPRGSSHIPRSYTVPPSVPQPVRTLGTAKHCPYCGGLFHCTCVRTWTFEHLDAVRHKLSAPLIWIRNPWQHPGVSKLWGFFLSNT